MCRKSKKSRIRSYRLVRCVPKRELANEKIDFSYKKWPLHLLTTAFLLPLCSSGTRSATLFLEKTLFLRTFLWQLSWPCLVGILTLAGSQRRALEMMRTLRETRNDFFRLLAKTTLARCASFGCVAPLVIDAT
jgi:hypothetical protein